MGQHSCLSIDVDVVPQIVGQHRENTDFCVFVPREPSCKPAHTNIGFFPRMERTQYNALKRRLSVQTELELAAGDGVEQVSGVLLLRVVEDLVGGGVLHELAVLHHHDLVGDLADHGQIVGDE